jgi:hypothetical protein
MIGNLSFLPTPLCPARHLPLKGGDWKLRCRRLPGNVSDWLKPTPRPISPFEGEMSGRTEGNRTECDVEVRFKLRASS